ncbi:MAG: hypothetical protein KAR13_15250 [Desulfobulbaceae bacterium]|nr:hypothetical protein [Desulfobulbaceae bacterium]MCK5323134.1 hypothetical protein [Desulfobulbaceae bacterium]MCK5436682.1 hypothetical protein [Desulfobulbaceae bacterium]MCK5543612.1 hypothetical protein [Desulfobulbaceae bacterium]
MEEVDSKLIPILRQGVDVMKLIVFKKLKEQVAKQYSDQDNSFVIRLTGAVINDIFGIENPDEAVAVFREQNRERIRETIDKIPEKLDEMCIPLTDALRVAVLCDNQEGVDNSGILARAKEMNILLVDRDLPLPHNFLELVRTLGSAFGLITPPVEDDMSSSEQIQ